MIQTTRRNGGLAICCLAICCVALLGMAFMSAGQAEARVSKLNRVRVLNGGETRVSSARFDLTRKNGKSHVMTLRDVDSGAAKSQPNCCCWRVGEFAIGLRVEGKKDAYSASTLACRFPNSQSDLDFLKNGSITFVNVVVGREIDMFGKPMAQAIIHFSNRQFCVRGFDRDDVQYSDEDQTLLDGGGGEREFEGFGGGNEGPKEDEPQPFVRIRLKNEWNKKSSKVEVRTYYGGATARESRSLISPNAAPHGWVTKIFTSNLRAKKCVVCLQYDANGNDVIDANEHFAATYDGEMNACLLRSVLVVIDDSGQAKAHFMAHYNPNNTPPKHYGQLCKDKDTDAASPDGDLLGVMIKTLPLTATTDGASCFSD